MLTLSELRRVAESWDVRFKGHRVERWIQPDALRLVVTVYGRQEGRQEGREEGREEDSAEERAGAKRHLLLCAGPEVGRASEVAAPPGALAQPPAFVSYLRAHLSGARVRGASILGQDRQLALRLEAREGDFELVLSLFGRRSNLYLTDGERRLVASLRRLDETRPELTLGEPFASPSRGVRDPGGDRFAGASDAEYPAAVERAYASLESDRGAAALAQRLSRALRRERKNAERRLLRVESELAEADQASVLQRHGDLLKSALRDVEPGASEIRVRDWETGEDVAIALDPAKSARDNLEAIFKRYQKLIRRLTKAGGQVDAARARRDEILVLQERCEALGRAAGPDADDPDAARAELSAIAERPEIAKLLSRVTAAPQGSHAAEKEAKRSLPARLRDVPRSLLPRRYLSRDGLEIWVGRSDAGNDHLSTRLARGHDLFFHLDGAPGSHVILRTEGRGDPPQESVLDACELAVRFSKQRNATRADVHVVPIKNVKKPRGAKPGLVYVHGGRTVHLRREDDRLERVLKSRIED